MKHCQATKEINVKAYLYQLWKFVMTLDSLGHKCYSRFFCFQFCGTQFRCQSGPILSEFCTTYVLMQIFKRTSWNFFSVSPSIPEILRILMKTSLALNSMWIVTDIVWVTNFFLEVSSLSMPSPDLLMSFPHSFWKSIHSD